MRKLSTSVVFLFCTLQSPTVFAAGVIATSFKSAVVSELNSNPPVVLYTIERTQEQDEEKTVVVSTYKDPSGAIAVIEKLKLNGTQFHRFVLDHKQLGSLATVTVKDNKVNFVYKKGEDADKAQEDNDDSVVVGPTLIYYIQNHWKELAAGEDIKIRYVITDRKETIKFKLSKVKESPFGDTGSDVVIKMRPSSLLLTALVNPVYLRLSPDGSKIVAMKGRVLPKRKSGEEWKDLDADVTYTY